MQAWLALKLDKNVYSRGIYVLPFTASGAWNLELIPDETRLRLGQIEESIMKSSRQRSGRHITIRCPPANRIPPSGMPTTRAGRGAQSTLERQQHIALLQHQYGVLSTAQALIAAGVSNPAPGDGGYMLTAQGLREKTEHFFGLMIREVFAVIPAKHSHISKDSNKGIPDVTWLQPDHMPHVLQRYRIYYGDITEYAKSFLLLFPRTHEIEHLWRMKGITYRHAYYDYSIRLRPDSRRAMEECLWTKFRELEAIPLSMRTHPWCKKAGVLLFITEKEAMPRHLHDRSDMAVGQGLSPNVDPIPSNLPGRSDFSLAELGVPPDQEVLGCQFLLLSLASVGQDSMQCCTANSNLRRT